MIITGKIPQADIDITNQRLADIYGKVENLPRFRVVWSEDEIEKRKVNKSPEGFHLLNSIVIEVPKYRQWIHEKYILERLTIIDEFAETELVGKISYEPLFVFETNKGQSLYPRWDAIRIIIENVQEQIRTAGFYTKYKDPSPEEKESVQVAKIKALQEELFGNESKVGDSLAYKEGIVVP